MRTEHNAQMKALQISGNKQNLSCNIAFSLSAISEHLTFKTHEWYIDMHMNEPNH